MRVSVTFDLYLIVENAAAAAAADSRQTVAFIRICPSRARSTRWRALYIRIGEKIVYGDRKRRRHYIGEMRQWFERTIS